jgi:hypothetical protein
MKLKLNGKIKKIFAALTAEYDGVEGETAV